MVKFKATITYTSEPGPTTGRWTFLTEKAKGGSLPEDDRDIAALLRAIADQIDHDARQKLN